MKHQRTWIRRMLIRYDAEVQKPSNVKLETLNYQKRRLHEQMEKITRCVERICNNREALPEHKAYASNDLEEIARGVKTVTTLIEVMEARWK
jgi:hypothetical protein